MPKQQAPSRPRSLEEKEAKEESELSDKRARKCRKAAQDAPCLFQKLPDLAAFRVALFVGEIPMTVVQQLVD